MTHTFITGSYTPAYTTYRFNGANHNWDGSSDLGNGTPASVNANTLDPTYTWSLTANGGGVATIGENSGVLTLSGTPTGNITVLLTVSNLGTLSNKTVDFTLTRAAIAENVTTEATITGPTISPTTAALYKDDAQAFTATATAVSVTSTVPAHVTLTGGGNTYYYYSGTLYGSTDDFVSETSTPLPVTLAWTKTGGGASYLTFSTTSGSSTTVSHATQSPSDLTATVTVTASASGASNQTASATVTAYGPMVAPTITRTGNTITLATTGVGATIYYTTDGTTTPSAINGTLYTAPFDLTTSPTTVKAIAIRDGRESTVTTSEEFQITLPAPVITISNTGLATITAEYGAEIHYTTDGSTPTAGSATYSGAVPLTNMQEIKAIAVKSGYVASGVATADYVTTGVSGSNVVLDDREDHNWSYYSDATLPAQLRSLNPVDVKITYYGNGSGTVSTTNGATPATNSWVENATTVQVGYDEEESVFVYYKTLERTDGSNSDDPTGRCKYITISNPFSVRPTYQYANGNLNKYCGFYGWRIASISNGKIYTAATGGTEKTAYTSGNLADANVLDADGTYYFAPDAEYGMEVELEALWARAYVKTGDANTLDANNVLVTNLTGGSYERNFFVITSGNTDAAINVTHNPVTISCRYPDGTSGGSLTSRIQHNFTGNNVTKFEYVDFNAANRVFNAHGYGLIFGRGCTGSVGTMYGNNTNSNINQTIRLESGTIRSFFGIGNSGPGNNMTKQHVIMGSDYDRATGEDENLFITDSIKLTITGNKSTGTDLVRWWVKSGTFQDNVGTGTAQSSDNCFYLWSPSTSNTGTGTRELTVEGGKLWHIAGGLDRSNNQNTLNLTVRIKGGTIRGCVFGGAARYDTKGYKRFVITGGTIQGWIAGGSNGYLASGNWGSGEEHGTVTGRSYIYVGGTTYVGGREDAINMSIGGYVFGAGCGNTNANTNAGSVSEQSDVAIADNAYVKHGVYGGGAYGSSLGTANVYILGEAIIDGDNDANQNVIGGVFGGARQKGGGTVNITMKGGYINKGGLYGGSNATGTLTGNVTMHIDGGQVGEDASHTANIHGGGFGQPTVVSRNVELTLGTDGATSGVTVYGDVYGGSALGSVNGTSANTDYHTYVTMYKGTIHGSLYGGALGQRNGINGATSDIVANVYGPVAVKIYGGSVLKPASNPGSVFGANNLNGAPQRSVTVDIYGTDPAPDASHYAIYGVYGGGNRADYTYGNGYPTVKVHNCNNSIEYVYGGGNAAAVSATDVEIYGGNKIGNVFGGGNGTEAAANVNGAASVVIYGGTIEKVFGGSNTNGTISGNITVNVSKGGDSDPEGTSTACAMKVGEVYGGGNHANSQAGTITIGCTGDLTTQAANPSAVGYTLEGIGDVYGGANEADITSGTITLNIVSGMVNRVFGGNNTSGSIANGITVNINKNDGASCASDWYCGEVYGGGNMADYGGTPAVNIINGTVSRNVYGGGNNITANGVGVAGGNVTMTGGLVQGNVFGGCNTKGTVTGTTSVSISAGTVNGSVFGGGLGANTSVTGKATVTLSGTAHIDTDVYGGGSEGTVNGGTQVTIEE